ncbi:DUF5803 family protein [Halocatena halophila]|uniref:DUF5803 family protein n=1 Tax=Halocatena halophila TaxID=2814576 RepID=UPI002ED6077F
MKRTLALVIVALLAVSAGCLSLANAGDEGDGVAQLFGDEKQSNVTYDWETDTDATITIGADTYRSVYKLDTTTIELYYRGEIDRRQPVSVEAVRYRYSNGTVIDDHPKLTTESNDDVTTITVPEANGTVAFQARSHRKEFIAPVYLGREKPSYEVILPPDTDVSIPVVSSVHPQGATTTTENGRVHIRWDEVTTNSIAIKWYLTRDLYIFAGILGAVIVVGSIGMAYYVITLRKLREQREQMEVESIE